MSRELFRLTTSLYNKPHLSTIETFSSAVSFLQSRNSGVEFDSGKSPTEQRLYINNGIGVLHVVGALTYREVEPMCGEVVSSYEGLLEEFTELVGNGAKTVVMAVDSGGGEAAHCFETAIEIRKIADDNGVKLIGYADTRASSAAYALISVCDYVVANTSSEVGSIGVLVVLTDTSQAMRDAGIKNIYITAGKSKVPYADDGSYKRDFIDDIQKRVDDLWDEFSSFISITRGISVENIKAMDAKEFTSKEALSLGLVDSVMSNSEFAAFVAKVNYEK